MYDSSSRYLKKQGFEIASRTLILYDRNESYPKDNKYNGQGSYYWKDGRKYVGQWKNDDKHGQGTFTWPRGNKYMGQWKNDKQHGQGTMTYTSGKIEKGIWENGKFMYAQGSQNP